MGDNQTPIKLEFEDIDEEEIASFLEEYDTIKDRLEKVLEKYPIARTKGFGTIATIFLYYWHYHSEQLIKLAQAIYILVKKKRRVKVVRSDEGKRIIPMTLRGDDLDLFLNAIRGLTNPEDIVRNKRRIQNDEGKFRPPEEDEEQARYREELIRRAMAKSKFDY